MNKIICIFLTLFFLLSATFLKPSVTIIQAEDTIPTVLEYEIINMKDGFRYLLKRVKEKVTIVLLSNNSQKKLNYYEKLLNNRLAELKYVVDNKDIANIQVASQRYFSTAGQLTSFLLSKSELVSNKNYVKNIFSKHVKTLEILKTSYNNTTAEWRFLRDDINYLNDYSTMLK